MIIGRDEVGEIFDGGIGSFGGEYEGNTKDEYTPFYASDPKKETCYHNTTRSKEMNPRIGRMAKKVSNTFEGILKTI